MRNAQLTNEARMDGGNYEPCTGVKDSQGKMHNFRCGNLLLSGDYISPYAKTTIFDILDKKGTSWNLPLIGCANDLNTFKCSIQGDYAQETQTIVSSFKNDKLPIGKVTIRSIGITNYKITRPNF